MFLDFLQKTVGSIPAKTETDFSALKAMIKESIGHVHVRQTGGDERVAQVSDTELVGGLAALQVELRAACDSTHIRDPVTFRRVCEPVFAHIDAVLATPGALTGLETFEKDLFALHGHLQTLEHGARKRTKWVRSMAWLLSAGPIVGFLIHWGITNYYSVALLESIDVFYPQQRFVLDADGYYRADYDGMQDTIASFEDYYFHATRSQSRPKRDEGGDSPIVMEVASTRNKNPLPTVFNQETATNWSVPQGETSDNLFVFRVFLKNLKKSNLVSKVGVTAKRSEDSGFFWDRLNLATELELYPRRHFFTVLTTRAPVKDVALEIAPVQILDEEITPAVRNNGHIVTSENFHPQFGDHPLFEQREFPVYYRFPRDALPAEATRRATKPRLRKNDRRAMDRAFDIVHRAITSNPLVRIDCRDDTTMLVASDMAALELTTRVARVDTLSVGIDYALLNGQGKSIRETLEFPTPFVFIDQTHRTERNALFECLMRGGMGGDVASAQGLDRARSAQIIRSAAVLAGVLNPDLALDEGAIVIEATFHLDLRDATSITKFHRELAVMDVGDFAAINIVLTNYPSGIYDFAFFFNDESVSTLRMDPLWPASLRYKPKDAPLFTKVHNE